MSDAPLNDWLPMANADFRNWGPWIFHDKAKERPMHVRVSYTRETEPDTVIYLTEYGSGWGRNHSPTWEDITWYRMRTEHPHYKASRTNLIPDPMDDPRVKALVEAATEVGRISDRDHVAWHRLAAALAALKGGA